MILPDTRTPVRVFTAGLSPQISRPSSFGLPLRAGWVGRHIFLCTIVICLVGLAATADATTPEAIITTGNVYVSNISYEPGTFFTGDTGTATFTVTNGNSNTSVTVNHAAFGDTNFQLASGTYDTSSSLGPLQSYTYVFSFVANADTGTYYPVFSLSFRDADNLYYRSMVKIDNTPLVMTVQEKPDAFTQGKKDILSVQIANPRQNRVKNIVFKVKGENVTLTPSEIYIGDLAPGTSTQVNFSVTPDSPSLLEMTADYDNGDNHHSVDLALPVSFTSDKQQAHPVISNIAVTKTAGTYHVVGDITNAGLLTANGVTVTSLSPAEPQDPYRTYVIGALKPDDFGSFEITFTAPEGTDSIPLQTSYKDKDGNIVVSEQPVDLMSAETAKDANPQPNLIPVIVIVVLIMAAGVAGYVYLRKQRKQ